MEFDWFSAVLGLFAICFGGYTLFLRNSSPEKLRKLTAMKSAWGESKGNAIHLVAYSILPIVLGVMYLIQTFV